jgi:hypothetical protein
MHFWVDDTLHLLQSECTLHGVSDLGAQKCCSNQALASLAANTMHLARSVHSAHSAVLLIWGRWCALQKVRSLQCSVPPAFDTHQAPCSCQPALILCAPNMV